MYTNTLSRGHSLVSLPALLLSTALVVGLAPPARGNTDTPPIGTDYIYSFGLDSQLYFGWGPEVFGWSVDVPDLLTGTTSFSTFLNTGVDGCTISASIDNPLSSAPTVVTNFGGLSSQGLPCHGSVTQGFATPFSAPGDYEVSNPLVTSTMDITATPSPEPATLLLLSMALMCLGGFAIFDKRVSA